MRVAVLGATESWYLHDLQRAAGERHQVYAVPFRRLQAHVSSAAPTVSSPDGALAGADAVLVRTMPAGSLEQVVFRMDALAALAATGLPVINPPKAIEAAVDKYLTTFRLAEAGLPVPRTIVCQTPDEALQAFFELGQDVVLKPLFGAEGRGLVRLTDEGLAQRTFSLLVPLGAVLYLQEFVPHPGYDLRALVIGSQVFGMKRTNPNDWRTNASRGALCLPHSLTPSEIDLALRSSAALGAPLAGVALLPTPDGRLLCLEVNAVPGWQALSRTLQVDIAACVLRLLETQT